MERKAARALCIGVLLCCAAVLAVNLLWLQPVPWKGEMDVVYLGPHPDGVTCLVRPVDEDRFGGGPLQLTIVGEFFPKLWPGDRLHISYELWPADFDSYRTYRYHFNLEDPDDFVIVAVKGSSAE